MAPTVLAQEPPADPPADEPADPPADEPGDDVSVGTVGGDTVAVAAPPVPTTVVVAVGQPPVPPTTVVVAVGQPPVPPSSNTATPIAAASRPTPAPRLPQLSVIDAVQTVLDGLEQLTDVL
jgi:hypothetical protein